MRIATWNVNSLKVRIERVVEWIGYASPDVLCLQETKLTDAAFPSQVFADLGYESVHDGLGQWNGVAIVSRVGIEGVQRQFSEAPPELAKGRFISGICGGVEVASVYVPNGRSLDSEHYQTKLRWMEALATHFGAEAARQEPVAICGDFNIAPEDRDVWDISHFAGSTHVSQAERDALSDLAGRGYVDAFRLLQPQDRLYTWWDYRGGSFHKHQGMRIDLILVSDRVAPAVTYTLVDRNARKGQQPSDHAPLLVDVEV